MTCGAGSAGTQATLSEGPILRACITNDDTSPDDIDVLSEELQRAQTSNLR